MLRPAEFHFLALRIGEPVTFTQVKAPNTVIAISHAIVQDLSRAPEMIINAYGINGRSVQMAAADFVGVIPERFDVIERANGERYTLDAVHAEHERGGGVSYYICYAKGK
jgi:hypothetical protein